ncbi:MAG: hypothetical protein HYY06_31800 [Deltaproteobacteria bacterium]|nr:hypothetical protein [Deltaproteobacteria bacterium]
MAIASRRPVGDLRVWCLIFLAGCGAKTGLTLEPRHPEECDDGLDNDGDGLVDERCACQPAAVQVCYSGPESTEGVGICRAGQQECALEEDGAQMWGPCKDEVTPATEQCVGGLDDDCDGRVDCDDDDCEGDPICGVEDCTPRCPYEECDGRDNNGDGRIDEGRVCDGIDGPCPAPGAIRICDAYCGVHQRCRVDGSWGPCIVDGQGPVPECDEHEDCPYEYWCDYGECVPGEPNCNSDDDCNGGWLGMDGWCVEERGICVSDCYAHSDCDKPLVCDLGACVNDPYSP